MWKHLAPGLPLPFSLKVAALGHDLGHTGTSNAFLVNSRDELALLYNDVAVRYSSIFTWVRNTPRLRLADAGPFTLITVLVWHFVSVARVEWLTVCEATEGESWRNFPGSLGCYNAEQKGEPATSEQQFPGSNKL